MSFTDGKPFVVTEKQTKASWSFAPNGKLFKCGICGHRFVVGDIARWLYTNHLPEYGSNPMLCAKCDGPDAIDKWKAHCDEWKAIKHKYWKFWEGPDDY